MAKFANLVNKDRKEPSNIPSPSVPVQVLRSSPPDPESTRGRSSNKTQFRKIAESKTSEIPKGEEKKAESERERERVFSRSDEPVVKGTIVITVFENHPYEVEFSGKITGAERDLAWRAMMKGYMVWKAKVAKEQERRVKEAKAKADADNININELKPKEE